MMADSRSYPHFKISHTLPVCTSQMAFEQTTRVEPAYAARASLVGAGAGAH